MFLDMWHWVFGCFLFIVVVFAIIVFMIGWFVSNLF